MLDSEELTPVLKAEIDELTPVLRLAAVLDSEELTPVLRPEIDETHTSAQARRRAR